MKKLTIILALFASTANAACYSNGFNTVCDNGNTYNQFQNTVQGYNPNTGSHWNSVTFGNTTTYTDAKGRQKTCTTGAMGVVCY